MILKRKALIDFRNWLKEKYNIPYHEFEDMPDAGKLGYYLEFFKLPMLEMKVIEYVGEQYNELHEKEN